jgi:SNF2 family DNA or RNA helicase
MTREVALSKEQQKHYKEMKALALTMLESGELSTSASALTTLIRLQQIALGFAKTDDGELIDIPNNRLSELMQVLSEAEGKVVIYCTFRHSIKQIETEIIKQYGQDSVCTYFGDTKSEKRQEVINDFQNPDSKLRFFVGQISTAGYGITLTQSSLCLFFSNSFNLADRIQAEDRLHRIGQSKSVTYVDFISPKTIDVKIIKALRSKIDIASTVLGESLKEWLEI